MVGVPDLRASCDDPAVAATGEVGFVVCGRSYVRYWGNRRCRVPFLLSVPQQF